MRNLLPRMLWLELALVLGVGFAVFALPRASSAAVTVSHISAPPPPPPATITIKEPGRGDLPPNPPPVVAPVLMSVDGNGGIKTVGSARSAQERKPPAQPINCGTVGVACVTEVQPGTSVRVRAQPAAGYVFAGWTSGCSGTNATCTVNAGTGKAVNARFARRPGKLTVQIKIRARIVSSFNQSSGRGTLILNGTINAPASLRVQLRRPGGSVLLTRRLRTSGGPFGLRALLKRGTLAGGVEFLPGGFVVSVRGAAGAVGAIGVPLQMRSIYVNPPAEGVVGKAYSSDTAGGRPLKTLQPGVRQAWAIFRFASQATAAPLTVSWYSPGGALIGTKEKNNRPIIRTGIASAGPIPSGTYRVELRAGGKLAKKVLVKID